MELLKSVRRRRSLFGEIAYYVLNIGLAIAVTLVVVNTGSPWMALVLVIISKWRVFAVRPRYWWVNFKSNLVDFILSISVVVHLLLIVDSAMGDGSKVVLLSALTALYIGWLVWLKPRSSRRMVAAQAGVTVLMSTSALFSVSYAWPVSIVVLVMWLIGYVVAHHIFSSYDDESHGVFLSLAWGLVFAEIGWLAYHWTVAYALPVFSAIQLPQVTIVVTLLSFLAYTIYDSYHHHQKVRSTDILLPLLLTVSVVVVLLLFFNRVGSAI